MRCEIVVGIKNDAVACDNLRSVFWFRPIHGNRRIGYYVEKTKKYLISTLGFELYRQQQKNKNDKEKRNVHALTITI
jgi:hypothetical protein